MRTWQFKVTFFVYAGHAGIPSVGRHVGVGGEKLDRSPDEVERLLMGMIQWNWEVRSMDSATTQRLGVSSTSEIWRSLLELKPRYAGAPLKNCIIATCGTSSGI